MPKRMDDLQKQALVKAMELNRQGMSWPEGAELLTSQGVFTLSGKPYTGTTLRTACMRLKDTPPLEAKDKQAKRAKGKRSDTKRKPAQLPDKDDVVTRKDLEALMQRVESLIDKKLQAALEVRKAVASVPQEDDPPKPPKDGKRYLGKKWKDIRARIDSNLMTLLAADCESHYSGNMSRCLDTILWRYYGRPALSYESPSEPTEITEQGTPLKE